MLKNSLPLESDGSCTLAPSCSLTPRTAKSSPISRASGTDRASPAGQDRAAVPHHQHRAVARTACNLRDGKPASQPRLSLAELDAAIGAYIVSIYNVRPHRAIRMAPVDTWRGNGWLPRMPETLAELDSLLVMVAKPRTVHRDGIRFEGLRYFDPTLAAYVGEPVHGRGRRTSDSKSGLLRGHIGAIADQPHWKRCCSQSFCRTRANPSARAPSRARSQLSSPLESPSSHVARGLRLREP